MSNTKKKPLAKQFNIHEETKMLHQQAIKLAKNHIDTKPIKYLLKK